MPQQAVCIHEQVLLSLARLAQTWASLPSAQDYRPGTLFSDIEVDAPRRGKHFSDREREPAGATPLPPPMPDLPHAGLGLGPAPGATMGFGPGGMPVDDGSFAGEMRRGVEASWRLGEHAFRRHACKFEMEQAACVGPNLEDNRFLLSFLHVAP